MDRLESLGNQLSQITMYDIKSYYNQAKNVILNVSEMEAKVREATNEDPWGASSTLMQDIAQGTFNFQNFNEIMPCIYSRFMEKEASQWRQIYKALQLLEYIIKHGSERVVDDARAHISTVKMLRNFHYVDEKAKDQGINVRHRAKELVELLSDLDRVRAERRKAKSNRNKYTGVGNDNLSFTSGGGGRYGGFGSESLGGDGGGYSGGGNDDYYGGSNGGGGGGGASSSSFSDNQNRRGFEEYDAGDYEESSHSSSRPSASSSSRTAAPARSSRTAAPPAPAPKAPAPVVDLLGGFGDDDFAAPAAAPATVGKPLPTPDTGVSLDDDFDDFQSAPASAPPSAAPTLPISSPVSATSAPKPSQNVFDMLGGGSAPAMSAAPMSFGAPLTANKPMVPNYSSSTPLSPASARPGLSPTASSITSPTSAASSKPASSGNFDDLWDLGFGGSSSSAAKPAAGSTAGKSIKDLEREKAQAGMWGSSGASSGKAPMGAFATSNSGGGNDDLLL